MNTKFTAVTVTDGRPDHVLMTAGQVGDHTGASANGIGLGDHCNCPGYPL